jgi:hypothetical protein
MTMTQLRGKTKNTLVTQKRKNLKEEVPSNGAAVNKNPRELQ